MKVHFNNELKLSNKTFFLSKIPKNTNPTIDENISSLFANPNTYLQLPEESKFSFVIGRRLKGPRLDENDNLIPYSIVGEKYYKKKKIFSIIVIIMKVFLLIEVWLEIILKK